MILFVADRIKDLREKAGMTQTQLARRLKVSRSAVNSWEMSLSTPSSIYLAELSKIFGVTTDYLLSLDDGVKVDITDLDEQEQEIVIRLVDHFKTLKNFLHNSLCFSRGQKYPPSFFNEGGYLFFSILRIS